MKKEPLERIEQLETEIRELEEENRTLLSRIRDIRVLRQEVEILTRITETSPAGIVVVDQDGQITFANAQAESVLGLKKDDLTQRAYNAPDWKISDFDGNPFPYERLPYQVVERTRQPVNDIRHAIEWPDGKRILLSINAAPLIDQDGQFEGMVATVEDITDRIRVEIAFEQNKSMLRQVVDTTPNCVFVKDRDGKYLLINEKMAELHGTTPEEMVGKYDYEIAQKWFETVDYDEFRATEREKIDNKEIQFILEEPFTYSDGTERWFQTTKIPFELEEDQNCLLVISTDITERKRAEDALRESEEKYRRLIETANDAIFVAEADTGIIIDANQRAAELIGRPVEEILGMHQTELHPPAKAEEYQQIFAEHVLDRTSVTVNILVLHKDGHEIPVDVSASLTEIQGRKVLQGIFRDITKRVTAENALIESERFLQNVFDAIQDGVSVLDRDLTIVRVNPWMEKMYADQLPLVGKKCYQVYQNRASPCPFCTSIPALDTGKAFTENVPYPSADDPIGWLELSSFPLRDHDGEIVGVIEYVKDISERVHARKLEDAVYRIAQAPNHSESLDDLYAEVHAIISEVMNANNFYIALYDEDDDLLNFPFFIDQMDAQPNPARPGRGLTEYVIQTGKSLLRDRSLHQELEQNGDVELIGTDPAIWLGVPLRIEKRVIGVMAVQDYEDAGAYGPREQRMLEYVSTQVAEAIAHKRTEQEREQLLAQIQEQAQRVEQIIETVPEGVFLLDSDQRVLLANPVATNMLETLSQINVGEVLTQLGGHAVIEFLTSPPKGLWHSITISGQATQRYQLIARPLETGKNNGGWVMVVRDVTRQHEVEEHIQQQERLAAVGQMAAGIAHDFNNILGAITLYAQLAIQDEPDSSPNRERMDVIFQQAMQASELVRQILDFSRGSDLERIALDLVPLLKEQVQMLKRTLPENITIRMTYDKARYDQSEAGAFIVHMDPTRIQQAVMNLAINARDAMPAGGRLDIGLKTIRISPDERPPLPEMEPGNWVQITLADSGIGISPDVLPHIFNPFFTTKGPGEGTGLGLAQVYGIIKSHEGAINVNTAQGEGTTFSIYLPAAEEQQSQTVDVALTSLPQGAGETILVVEDNEAIRGALIEMLDSLNYKIVQAHNGVEALTYIESHGDVRDHYHPIDLVLSDVVMPGMGGVSLFHSIREAYPQIGVVLITGHPVEKELETLKLQGLCGWLPKPPNVTELAQMIAEALRNREQ